MKDSLCKTCYGNSIVKYCELNSDNSMVTSCGHYQENAFMRLHLATMELSRVVKRNMDKIIGPRLKKVNTWVRKIGNNDKIIR